MKYSDLYRDRILTLCKKRTITLNRLSTMSGVSHSTLENIVKGKSANPKVITLHKIAISFNMTLSEFLDFEELNDYSFDN